MKKSLTKMEPLDEGLDPGKPQKRPLNLILKSRKRRPKRDGCMGGSAAVRHSPGAAGGAAFVPAGNSVVGPYGTTAISLEKIAKNMELSAKNVKEHPRTSTDELTYRQVLKKVAVQEIGPNQTVKKGMVKKP